MNSLGDMPSLEFIETWSSNIYMTPETVWKIKKPVHLGSLDYTTLEGRREACERELELNRALAPGVYLDLSPVTSGPDGRVRIGGKGPPIDWAIRMHRLADRDRIDERIRDARIDDDDVHAIARAIAAFHERTPQVRVDTRERLRAAIELEPARIAEDTLPGLRAALEAQRWQRAFLDEHPALFEQRDALGHIRDGHGEIVLDHVFVDDDGGVRIIDRLEFDAELRKLDVCADIASLANELAASGRVDLADRFVADYAAEANDFDLYSMLNFYSSLRASLCGKMQWGYADFYGRDPLSTEARRAKARMCFKLAAAAGRQPLLPPAVVVVAGLVASGKSTVARQLGREIGAPVISSDRTRDFLLGARLNEGPHEVRWERAYKSGFGDEVYAEMMRRAGVVLRSGNAVVLDGCFRTAVQRSTASDLAAHFGHPFLFVEARVSERVCVERLHQRSLRDDEPDSTWLEIARDLRANWESADEVPEAQHIVLDTALPIADNLAVLRARLATWPER